MDIEHQYDLAPVYAYAGPNFQYKKLWHPGIWHQYNIGLKCEKFGTPFFYQVPIIFFFKEIVKTGTKFNFDQITQF